MFALFSLSFFPLQYRKTSFFLTNPATLWLLFKQIRYLQDACNFQLKLLTYCLQFHIVDSSDLCIIRAVGSLENRGLYISYPFLSRISAI